MPFDGRGRAAAIEGTQNRRRFAVIGAGVSGLSAAWLLSQRHDVVLYERDRRLGGHANTADVPTPQGDVPVDAGFIVFNKPNYPNLTALFDRLGVEIDETDMSFGVSFNDGAFEFSSRGLGGIFARSTNAISPSHWVMIADIFRFNARAKAALAEGLDDAVTLGEFVAAHGFSQSFVKRFLEPMAAAIWSTPSLKILDYPAASLFRFYANHGLLQTVNMPLWNTVKGGSKTYVERLAAPFCHKARLGVGVRRVARTQNGVVVTDDAGNDDRFDDVVIAAHADRALAMIENPTTQERRLLGAFAYQANRAVLHSDARLMPQRRRAWASWNYLGGEGAPAVSYWMNLLQNLNCKRDIFVTLNPHVEPRDETIVAEFNYAHPIFDVGAMKAQKELWSLQGVGGVWFCGAYFGAGFHEDGLQAGLAVAEDLGAVRRPWTVENESGRISRGAPAPALPIAAE